MKDHPDIAGLSWFSEHKNDVFSSPEVLRAFEELEKSLGLGPYRGEGG